MPIMQPQPSSPAPMQQPNAAQINSPGSGENDTGPNDMSSGNGTAPNMAPNPAQINSPGSGEPDGAGPQSNNQQQSPIVQALQQHLDKLPDQDKAMIAAYLTPETVKVIGLINGPEVANYFNQYADKNKVLVPVSRDQATAYLQKMQQQGGQQPGQPGQQAQGQPQQPAPQQTAQAAPQGQPQPMPQMPQQPLPNGVTPAPMQHGIMAPTA